MSRNKIVIASEVLKGLIEELKEKIREKYDVNPELILDYQLFGYGNYKEELPSIKKLIFDECDEWINGKYLYNKHKEAGAGNRNITLSREYKYIFFKVLGYKDYYDFLNRSSRNEIISAKDKITEFHENTSEPEQNYVGYYQGENNQIISCNLRLYNNLRSAEWTLYYNNPAGTLVTYQYFGKVNQNEKGTSAYFPANESTVSRSAFICIFNDQSLKAKSILLGCYAGFDEIRQPTSGEIILIKTKEKFFPSGNLNDIDPAIVQYLCNKRINVDGKFPESLYDLSSNSKYAFQLQDLIGEFHGVILSKKMDIIHIKLNISNNLMKCLLYIQGTLYNGFVQLIANNIVHGQFISSSDEKISIYIKSNFDSEEVISGYLNGYSKAKSIVGGKIALTNSKKHVDQINILLSQKNEELVKKYLSKKFQTFIGRHYEDLDEGLASSNYQFSNRQNLSHLQGNYKIYYRDWIDNEITEIKLEINSNGEFTITSDVFTYTGNATIFGNNILSLNIKKYNDFDFQSQLLIFVGRLSGSKIKLSTGTWQIINEMGKFSSFRVCLSSSSYQRSSYSAELEIQLPKDASKFQLDSFIMH